MLKPAENKEKNKIAIIITAFALILLLILIIVNIDSLKEFINLVLGILTPIIIGAAMAYVLNPLLKFFEFTVFSKIKNKKVIRALSLVCTYIFAILFIAVFIAILFPRFINSVMDLGANYNLYLGKATDFLNSIAMRFTENSDFFEPEQLKKAITNFIAESGDLFKTLSEYVISYASTLFSTVKNVFLALFISIYMLISKEKLYAQTTKLMQAFLSKKLYLQTIKYARISNSTFGRFFVGKIFDSIIVSLLTLILLLIFKMPYCLLIAAIVGIFNIIPFFGIAIGIIFTSFVILIASPQKLVTFLIIMLVVQQLDSNVIAPRILGRSAGISSLAVIISVIVMGSYFDIVGMIIGVPFVAIFISIITELINKKLTKKGMSADTADYYEHSEYSIESEERKTVLHMLWNSVLLFFRRLFHKKKRSSDKVSDSGEKSENDGSDK